MNKNLKDRAAEMKERNVEKQLPIRERRKRERFRKKLEEVAGPNAQVRLEVIPAGAKAADVKTILARMKLALKGLEGLTPDQIQEKISGLTQVLHVKLQLQVNEALDSLSSPDPMVCKGALNVVEALMPFITQISELNVKMQVALGLGEAKGKLIPRRTAAALPVTGGDWESQFGDTLTNKTIN
jgi:hypothetical protein